MKKYFLFISMATLITLTTTLNLVAMEKSNHFTPISPTTIEKVLLEGDLDQALKLCNNDTSTCLNILYALLAKTTISIKLTSKNDTHYYYITRPLKLKDWHICNKKGFTEQSTNQSWFFGGRTVSAEWQGEGSTPKFILSKDKWNGWNDLVYNGKDKKLFKFLIACMRALGENEINFAEYLFEKKLF